jgi:hypothetical protein
MYEETKNKIFQMQKRIIKLNSKNNSERKLQKQVNSLLQKDSYKWTNSFSRKSVLWD